MSFGNERNDRGNTGGTSIDPFDGCLFSAKSNRQVVTLRFVAAVTLQTDNDWSFFTVICGDLCGIAGASSAAVASTEQIKEDLEDFNLRPILSDIVVAVAVVSHRLSLANGDAISNCTLSARSSADEPNNDELLCSKGHCV
jgi:hypothetical protein